MELGRVSQLYNSVEKVGSYFLVLYPCTVSGQQIGNVDEMRAPKCRTISQQNIRAFRCGLRIPGDIRESKNRKSEQTTPPTVNSRNILTETRSEEHLLRAISDTIRVASTPHINDTGVVTPKTYGEHGLLQLYSTVNSSTKSCITPRTGSRGTESLQIVLRVSDCGGAFHDKFRNKNFVAMSL